MVPVGSARSRRQRTRDLCVRRGRARGTRRVVCRASRRPHPRSRRRLAATRRTTTAMAPTRTVRRAQLHALAVTGHGRRAFQRGARLACGLGRARGGRGPRGAGVAEALARPLLALDARRLPARACSRRAAVRRAAHVGRRTAPPTTRGPSCA